MQYPFPLRPAVGGTLNIPAATAGSGARPQLKSPAGYKFMGKDVWRVEVAGTLTTTNTIFIELYETRNGQVIPSPIAVRGWLKPSGSEYQRPLMFCNQNTNGGYLAAVEGFNEAGAGSFIPQYIYIYQITDASRAPGFAGATYKLQVDFIEL